MCVDGQQHPLNPTQPTHIHAQLQVNFAYIPGQIEGSYGLYMKARTPTSGLDDDFDDRKAARVGSVAEALEVLEDAVIAQGVGVRMDMVWYAGDVVRFWCGLVGGSSEYAHGRTFTFAFHR